MSPAQQPENHAVDAEDTGRRRVLLKLSGEVFGGGSVGIDPVTVRGIAEQIAEAAEEVAAAPTTWACSAP